MIDEYITQIRKAQKLVKFFAEKNGWPDIPDFHKFDHVHEELSEMSTPLLFLSEAEKRKYVTNNIDHYIDGVGDFYFAMCRLSNQLGIDVSDSFRNVISHVYGQTPDFNGEIRNSQDIVRMLETPSLETNIMDYFDSIHGKLIELSQHLRYKNQDQISTILIENKQIFEEGTGAMYISLCRLANELIVDMQEAFNTVKGRIFSKYQGIDTETNLVHKPTS